MLLVQKLHIHMSWLVQNIYINNSFFFFQYKHLYKYKCKSFYFTQQQKKKIHSWLLQFFPVSIFFLLFVENKLSQKFDVIISSWYQRCFNSELNCVKFVNQCNVRNGVKGVGRTVIWCTCLATKLSKVINHLKEFWDQILNQSFNARFQT